jgi:hypothetical protein
LCSLAGSQAMWVARMVSPVMSNSAEITAQAGSAAREVAGDPRVEGGDLTDRRFDLLGNEVENAVADYRIDRGGEVYERHSPETAVARLGSPSS